LDVLIEAFKIMQDYFEIVYIVVDGLDETEENTTMMQAMERGIKSWKNTRALFTSRDGEKVQEMCRMGSFTPMNISPQEDDIRRAVQRAVADHSDRRLEFVDATTKEAIVFVLLKANPK